MRGLVQKNGSNNRLTSALMVACPIGGGYRGWSSSSGSSSNNSDAEALDQRVAEARRKEAEEKARKEAEGWAALEAATSLQQTFDKRRAAEERKELDKRVAEAQLDKRVAEAQRKEAEERARKEADGWAAKR